MYLELGKRFGNFANTACKTSVVGNLLHIPCAFVILLLALNRGYSFQIPPWHTCHYHYSVFRRRSKKTSKVPSLDFCAGIHRWPVNSPHKLQVTRKMFPFDDVIMPAARNSASHNDQEKFNCNKMAHNCIPMWLFHILVHAKHIY